jgi:serine phosphatase RsbU (regulator of sigma subunit)
LCNATGRASPLDGTGLPIGIESHSYPTRTTSFSPQDVLLMYSDALLESTDGDGKAMKEEELAQTLEKHAGEPASGILEAVLTQFHLLNAKIKDDLTLILCKRSAA